MGREPRVFQVLDRDALSVRRAPTGDVGTSIAGRDSRRHGWVAKQGEVIDPDWFSQRTVDLILVLQGELRAEFAQAERSPVVLGVGNLLVLPPNTRCRAYHWPRDRQAAPMSFAVYPLPALEAGGSSAERHHAAE